MSSLLLDLDESEAIIITVIVFSCSVVSNSCDHMDCSLPGSSVHGISQAKTLEWVTIPFSRGSS